MMEHFGLNTGFFFFQLLNCLIPLLWLGLSIAALLGLKQRPLGETARVLWAILVCVVPVLGAIAFWIITPGKEPDQGVG